MKNHFLTLGILLFAGVAAQPALADSFLPHRIKRHFQSAVQYEHPMR